MARGEHGELRAPTREQQPIDRDQERTHALLRCARESRVDLVRIAGVRGDEFLPNATRCRLHVGRESVADKISGNR